MKDVKRIVFGFLLSVVGMALIQSGKGSPLALVGLALLFLGWFIALSGYFSHR